MKSNYKNGNIFNEVAYHKFPRFKFSLGHFNKLTMNHGLAVPFLKMRVVPGDRVDVKTFGRIQLQPLATSSMQNIRCYFRYFYVPYRLLWDEWDKFITQTPNAPENFDNPFVIVEKNEMSMDNLNPDTVGYPGLLSDYLGIGTFNKDRLGNLIPYTDNAKLKFNLWYHQAYHLIWDYYFRDENLQDPTTIDLTRGRNNLTFHYLNTLLPVAYEKDYFTTALPWPQEGDPVNLSAYVSSNSLSVNTLTSSSYSDLYWGTSADPEQDQATLLALFNSNLRRYDVVTQTPTHYDGTNPPYLTVMNPSVPAFGEAVVPSNTLSTSININDLRYSNALQRFLERKALGGSRPAEFYLSMYGVQVDDLRIGQPLYLGGGFTNISVTDVASTVEISGAPQGTLAGNGKAFPAVGFNHPYYCQEFGVIMGIMYIRPEINYTQGIEKGFTAVKPLDYYNPLFANLGEEAVMKSELLCKPDLDMTEANNNDDIFGYQSRYAYLKYMPNEVHGDFKTSLSSWLISAHFPFHTELNSDFITVAQNYDIFAIDDSKTHHYLVELFNDVEKESSMPNHVIPSL